MKVNIIYVLFFLLTFSYGQRDETSSDFIAESKSYFSLTIETDAYNAYKITEGGGDGYWRGKTYGQARTKIWQLTGLESDFLDALEFFEGYVATAKVSSVLWSTYSKSAPPNGVYFQDEWLSWIAHPQWGGGSATFTGGNYQVSSHATDTEEIGREVFLDHSQAMRDYTGFVNILKHSPDLRAQADYESRYQALVVFGQNQLDKHEDRNWKVKSKTYMSSHFAKMCLDWYYVTGVQKYHDYFDNWCNDISQSSSSYTGSFKGNHRIYGSDGGYTWESDWGDLYGYDNDWGHLGDSLNLIWYSLYYGETEFSQTDIDKFVIAINERFFNTTTLQWTRINGSGTSETQGYDTQAMGGAILFGSYNDDILESYEHITASTAIASSHSAVAAFAAAINDGDNIPYPEVAFTSLPIEAGESNGNSDPKNNFFAAQN